MRGVLAVLVSRAKVRIIGPKRRLGNVLEELHRLELVHLADVRGEEFEVEPLAGEDGQRDERADELRVLIAELEALLGVLGRNHEYRIDRILGSVDTERIRAQLEEVSPRVEELTRRLDALADEQVVLPRYLRPLEHLLPLVPELAHLEERAPDLLRELRSLLEPFEQEWRTLLAKLRAELEQLEAAALAGGTRRAFVVACWVPKRQLGHRPERADGAVLAVHVRGHGRGCGVRASAACDLAVDEAAFYGAGNSARSEFGAGRRLGVVDSLRVRLRRGSRQPGPPVARV